MALPQQMGLEDFLDGATSGEVVQDGLLVRAQRQVLAADRLFHQQGPIRQPLAFDVLRELEFPFVDRGHGLCRVVSRARHRTLWLRDASPALGPAKSE